MSQKKAKKWEFATIRKTQDGKVYIAFDKSVRLSIDGQGDIDLGEYNTIMAKDEDERSADEAYYVEQGFITQEQAEERSRIREEKRIAYTLVGPFS